MKHGQTYPVKQQPKQKQKTDKVYNVTHMTCQTLVNTVWRFISFYCSFCLHKCCCLQVLVIVSCVRRLHFNSWGQPFPHFEGCQPALSQNTDTDGNIQQLYDGAVAAGQVCFWLSATSETITLSRIHKKNDCHTNCAGRVVQSEAAASAARKTPPTFPSPPLPSCQQCSALFVIVESGPKGDLSH